MLHKHFASRIQCWSRAPTGLSLIHTKWAANWNHDKHVFVWEGSSLELLLLGWGGDPCVWPSSGLSFNEDLNLWTYELPLLNLELRCFLFMWSFTWEVCHAEAFQSSSFGFMQAQHFSDRFTQNNRQQERVNHWLTLWNNQCLGM